MTKVTLAPVANLIDATTAQTTINNNSVAIVAAMENTLSLDGTSPNQMQANLDMNGNRILNLPLPLTSQEPARLADLEVLTGGGTITINPLPTGGTTGQILTKNSNSNYDATWLNSPAGNVSVTGTPTTGQLAQWTDATTLDGVPASSFLTTGQTVNSVTSVLNTYFTVSGVAPSGNTIPTNTAGTEAMSVTITPTNTTNKLRIRFNGVVAPAGNDNVVVMLFQNSTVNAIAANLYSVNAGFATSVPLVYEFVPASTSPQTFHLRIGTASGSAAYINGNSSNQVLGGTSVATLIVEEIVT